MCSEVTHDRVNAKVCNAQYASREKKDLEVFESGRISAASGASPDSASEASFTKAIVREPTNPSPSHLNATSQPWDADRKWALILSFWTDSGQLLKDKSIDIDLYAGKNTRSA